MFSLIDEWELNSNFRVFDFIDLPILIKSIHGNEQLVFYCTNNLLYKYGQILYSYLDSTELSWIIIVYINTAKNKMDEI